MIGIDMEMPKSCTWCPLCDGEEWVCRATYEICNGSNRPEHCPLHFVTIKDTAEEIKVTKCNHIADIGKKDLISRQDVTDALDRRFAERIKQFDYDSYEKVDEKTQLVCDGIIDAIDVVLGLPSVQPDACENTCEITRKSNDTISRQAAIYGRCNSMDATA